MNFVTVKKKNDPAFSVMWDIYDNSFPEKEKRSIDEHVLIMKKDDFFSDVVYIDNEIVGILFYWIRNDYAYIEHFAVAAGKRGGGIGTAILKNFLQSNTKVVLEIEPPMDDVSIKRKHFYENIGFRIYDYKYFHPSYGKRYKPYPLCLMSYGIDVSRDDALDLQNFLYIIC